jgi:hypothetical protein
LCWRRSARSALAHAMAGGLAGDVTQDVPAAVIDAKIARRVGITGGFQVCQHPDGEPAASIPGTMDGVTDPDDLPGVVAAAQRLLTHSTMISQVPRRSLPGELAVSPTLVAFHQAMVMTATRKVNQ